MHSTPLFLIIVTIVVALLFDFLNGVHDAANSIATIVTTRVLTPRQAVVWAATFNFIAAFVFGTGVAHTISSNLIKPSVMNLYIVLGGLLGAVTWNLITWYLALPTSSSHAVISALAGAAIVRSGWHALVPAGWVPVLLFLVLSPLIGMVLGYIFMHIVAWITFHSTRDTGSRLFRRLQLISAGAYSLGHGTNDAQKTMGIIVALLISTGYGRYANAHVRLFGHNHEISLWIILSCHAAIALGT